MKEDGKLSHSKGLLVKDFDYGELLWYKVLAPIHGMCTDGLWVPEAGALSNCSVCQMVRIWAVSFELVKKVLKISVVSVGSMKQPH